MEEFEFSAEAYIKNDLEESEQETRRRYCIKFVHKLSTKFSADVQGLTNSYFGTFMGEYNANREANWLKKITLLNLLITVSIGSYTFKLGANEIKVAPETLNEYITTLVLPELQEENVNNLPMLKATCIKFIYMFRNQVPNEHVQQYVGLFCQLLTSESEVVKSYSAACIDKMLTKQDP